MLYICYLGTGGGELTFLIDVVMFLSTEEIFLPSVDSLCNPTFLTLDVSHLEA